MAEAIIESLMNSMLVEACDIFASDVSAARRALLKRRCGINVYANNRAVVRAVRVVFLSVKPQQLDDVLREIAPDVTKQHLVLSIAAGKKISLIESMLAGARVVRVMPNVACLVSEAISVFCPGSRVTDADCRTAIKLLSSFGETLRLPEDKFDAVTALSGSGPAFFTFLLDSMVNAGVEEGLDRKDALLLAEQTMLGTSRLLIEKKVDPRDLIGRVASAKGTTAAGLAVLEKSPVSNILNRTIKAAARRSRELSVEHSEKKRKNV